MTDCAQLQVHFDADPRPQDLAGLVDQHSPDCACERGRVSALGLDNPISDEEYLLRIVVSPKDVNDQSPPSFQESAILPIVGTGLSVLREAHASPEEILRLARARVDAVARNVPTSERVTIIGVLRFPASLARSRRFPAGSEHEDKPKYCIYETPIAEYPSHADVLITATRFTSKNKRKNDAFELFGELQLLFVAAADYGKVNLSDITSLGEKAS